MADYYHVRLGLNKERKMRVLNQKYCVVETKDYEQCFAEVINTESNPPKIQQLKLYEVDFYNPREDCYFLHYVLADSVEGAISQAGCAENCDCFKLDNEEQQKQIKDRTRVRHLPFLIRGWGKVTF